MDTENSNMLEEVIMPIVLVISTVVLAAVGVVSAIYNKKMISEMRIDREYNLEPFMTCKIKQNTGITMKNKPPYLSIVFHNHGKGPAKNIKVTLTTDQNILQRKKELKKEIDALGPNEASEIMLGIVVWTGSPEIKFELDYADIFEKPKHHEGKIHLPELRSG